MQANGRPLQRLERLTLDQFEILPMESTKHNESTDRRDERAAASETGAAW